MHSPKYTCRTWLDKQNKLVDWSYIQNWNQSKIMELSGVRLSRRNWPWRLNRIDALHSHIHCFGSNLILNTHPLSKSNGTCTPWDHSRYQTFSQRWCILHSNIFKPELRGADSKKVWVSCKMELFIRKKIFECCWRSYSWGLIPPSSRNPKEIIGEFSYTKGFHFKQS